jgi:bile acid:Na+ symporter, BASS family
MKILNSSILILVAVSIVAYLLPVFFAFFLPYLSYLLAIVMLLMGATLKTQDLQKALQNWHFAGLGTCLQFLCMPLIAYVLAELFQLPMEYKLGLILVGACPGGTASNVVVYLFKGNVPLSVLMTFMSTILSIVLTPFILKLYIGTEMDFPMQKIIADIFILVIIPIVLGYGIQRFLKPNALQVLEKYSSTLALVVIALIVAAIVSANVSVIQTMPMVLILVVMLHNGLGMTLGYTLTRVFTKEKTIARTIAIEVGMQNSGLGIVLANLYFSKAAALPAAIFSFWHNVAGVTLANYWNAKGE